MAGMVTKEAVNKFSTVVRRGAWGESGLTSFPTHICKIGA